MIWAYQTRIGTFWIRADRSGRFVLGVGDVGLGSYHSPHAAADDVYMCATGHWEWDRQGHVTEPTDLTEWQRLR